MAVEFPKDSTVFTVHQFGEAHRFVMSHFAPVASIANDCR